MRDLFAPTPAAWAARPGDPSDTFFAQLIDPAAPTGDAPARGVALFGVPFDGAVPSRPGARGGPDAIRTEMARLKPGELRRAVHDWGNVRTGLGDIAAAHQAMESAALAVLEREQFPLALGGDHSMTFPLVKAHEGRRTKLGVINLDAHLDVRDIVNGQLNSGQSFARIVDLGLVPGENLVELGIREFANSQRYLKKARKMGASVLTATEWRADPRGVLEHAVERAMDGTDGVYLSVDVDVLDESCAPGVSAPTPGGVDSATLYEAIRHIAKHARLVGADFVEVAPVLDRDNMTARAAAYGVMHLLDALA